MAGTKRRKSAGKQGTEQDRTVLIREYGFRLVARFIYSEKALRDRLARRYPDCIDRIEQVIGEFREYGYIDDGKNAAFLAGQLKARGFGPRYIRASLGRKGFAIPAGLSLEAGPEAMERWYRKKTGGLKPSSPKAWRSLYMYLAGKGFRAGEIADFLRKRGCYEGE